MGYDSCVNTYSQRKTKSKRNILAEILNGVFLISLLLISGESFGLNSLVICFCAACIRSINNIAEIILLIHKAYDKYEENNIVKVKRIISELLNGVLIISLFLLCGEIWSWKGLAICILGALIRNVDDMANLFSKK